MKTIVLLDYGVSKLLGAHCLTVAAKLLDGSVIYETVDMRSDAPGFDAAEDCTARLKARIPEDK